MSTGKKRLGGMSREKLAFQSFGRTDSPAPTEAPAHEPDPPLEPSQDTPKKARQDKQPKQEKLTTVNIKVTESQQEWLAKTAKHVRANNDGPVPPGDRVYPQHLIQVAIDVLKSQPIDWDEIKTAEDLRRLLNL